QLMQEADLHGYEYPRTPATDEAVLVDRPNEISETLIMGLRLLENGIEWRSFQERFGEDLRDIHGPVIDRFVGYHLLETDANGVRLHRQGRRVSSIIFRALV